MDAASPPLGCGGAVGHRHKAVTDPSCRPLQSRCCDIKCHPPDRQVREIKGPARARANDLFQREYRGELCSAGNHFYQRQGIGRGFERHVIVIGEYSQDACRKCNLSPVSAG
jgi:hypothetical protein